MVNGPGNLPEPIKPLPVPPAPRPKKPEFRPEPKPEFQATRDTVEISPAAREVRSLVPRIQAQPEIRPARVEEARASLSKAGNDASINAKIAEKLLTEL